jgi:hypothetical protein
MIEHVSDLLGAYLDGELHGLRLRQVEDHLGKCNACRKELAELQHLSTLLQESLPASKFTTTDRFAANLALRLNTQEVARKQASRMATVSSRRKPLEILGWLVPVGMLGAWVIIQLFFTASSLVSTANLAGLSGDSTAWLQAGSQQSLWYSASLGLFGNQLQGVSLEALSWLNGFSVLGADILTQLFLQVVIALIYWLWLGLWWKRSRKASVLSVAPAPSHS